MKKIVALSLLLLSASVDADVSAGTKYSMEGPISGYMAGSGGTCYIAITSEIRYYSDGYHAVPDSQMCALARAIYLLRGRMRAVAQVRYGTDTNSITDLEATRSGTPYWPPYHTGGNASHYGLIGPINGYLLVAGNKSCFVSSKGISNYSNGYHEVKDNAQCVALLGAYLDGSTVSMSVDKGARINQIVTVEINADHKAYWPPYGRL